MIAYYLIMTVLAFINLIILLFSFDIKKINANFTFMAVLMALANGGYLSIAISTSLQEAVLANKIVYLGGCFVPPVLLFSICVICNYNVADWLRSLLYTYSFFIYAMIVMESINCVLFICGRNLNPAFEIMPFMYVADGWILLYLNRRAMMYNIEDCIISSLGKQESYGYIMFDNHKNYLGSNSIAGKIFPEILDCKVDLQIKNKPEVEVVLHWINEYSTGLRENFSYEIGDRHYQCRIERIWHKEKASGYIVEIQEDTDKWNYMNLLSSYNAELERQVKEKTEHILNIQSQVLLGMANMVENRDGSTGGHIKRTSDVIRILVETIQEKNILPLGEEFCEDIIKAAPMHDLGKIGIDDMILKKPGRLTDEEFAIMQTHAEKSALLVESILREVEEEHFVRVAVNVAKYHHEKWNGTGYHEHLKGEDIPLEARIMAIADVYDALVSKRCYKEAMSFDKAFEVMQESMGSHFDPNLEKVFVSSREKLEEYYRSA